MAAPAPAPTSPATIADAAAQPTLVVPSTPQSNAAAVAKDAKADAPAPVAAPAAGAGAGAAAAATTAPATPATTGAPAAAAAAAGPGAAVSAADIKAKMEYRYLGRSGLRVSVLSLGAWTTWGLSISDDEAYQCLKAAFDMGANFFDNAESYGNGKAELAMGRCLTRLMGTGVDRSELVVSTKLFWGGPGVNQRGLSRKHILEGLDASLKRLGLAYVDVVFCHRPDPHTPIEETVRAMTHVINAGKAMYWGTSEWGADLIAEAVSVANAKHLIAPVTEQPQYSLLHRTRFEVEYARAFREMGLGATTWSPLAGGLLTGKYASASFPEGSRLSNPNYQFFKQQLLSGEGLNGLEEKNFDLILQKIDALLPIARELHCTLPQLAVAWCVLNPHVSTVITGASKASQVTENFHALTIVPKLTPEVVAQIEAVLQNKPKPLRIWK